MKITVQRTKPDKMCTEGQLFLDGLFECYDMEPPILPAPAKPRAIPAGTYPWVKYMSPHFGFEVVAVLNVPDFFGVEIHPGNFPADTHGCTIVGATAGVDFVGFSKEAFVELMGKLPANGTIQYIDVPEPETAT